MEKRNKITTAKQFETLISELEKKPSLTRGIHRGTTHVNTFRQDWEEVSRKLNTQGPPMRDCDGWLRVWKDFKFKLRKKILQKEAEEKGICSGKFKSIILYPLEKAAAKLISENQFDSEKFASEIQPPPIEKNHTIWKEEEVFESEDRCMIDVKTEDYGIMDQTFLGDEEYLPSPSVDSFQVQKLASPDRGKKKRNRKSERQELLGRHSAMQEKIFCEISSTMNELKNILTDSAYCHRKMLKIEEQKLEIMQRRQEREEQLFKSEMKLKLLEMKLKTKELETLEKQSKS